MPGVDGLVGGGLANHQAPPLPAERSVFLAQAELVPNTSDVDKGNNGTTSYSAVVEAEAIDESEPKLLGSII
jgi:hypothetical protein